MSNKILSKLSIIKNLPESVRINIQSEKYIGIICPCCDSKNHSGASIQRLSDILTEDNGFICYYCLNTGEKLTKEPSISGILLQSKETIKDIILKTGFEKSSDWYKYITIQENNDKSQIILTLQDKNSVSHSFSLKDWKTRLESKKRQNQKVFSLTDEAISSNNLAAGEHLKRMRKIHRHASVINLMPARSLSTWNCSLTTKIGKFKIIHPNFSAMTNKITRKIDECGDSACFCILCAEDNSLTMPKNDKSILVANSLWQYRTAKIATFLGSNDISHCSVSIVDESIEFSATASKLSFQCHNDAHEPVIDNYGNRFNKKRAGYCKQCLKEAGFKNYHLFEAN
jgi:hypothetical protein